MVMVIDAIWWVIRMIFRIIGWLAGMDFSKKKPFTGRWMTRREERCILKTGPKHKGFLIDLYRRLSLDLSFRNVAIFGPVGSGKSTKLAIPNLQRFVKSVGSAVLFDPSGEIFKQTAGWLRLNDIDCVKINVQDIEDGKSLNICEYAETDADFELIAHLLIKSTTSEGGGEQYWNNSAEALLGTLIKMLRQVSPENCNLPNVRHLINNFGGGEKLAQLFAQCDDDLYSEYIGFCSQDSKVLQGVLSTAKTALRIFKNEDIAKLSVSGDNAFDIRSLRKRRTVLYVQCSEEKYSYYSAYLNCIWNIIINELYKTDDPNDLPVSFILDEFPAMYIKDFDNILSTARKRRIGFMIFLQSISQLQKYGKHQAETILANTTSKIFLPGMDNNTAREIAESLGKIAVKHEEKSFSGKGKNRTENTSERTISRNLMERDELTFDLKDPYALFMTNAHRPSLIKCKPFFKNPALLIRSKIPAPKSEYDYSKPIDRIVLREPLRKVA